MWWTQVEIEWHLLHISSLSLESHRKQLFIPSSSIFTLFYLHFSLIFFWKRKRFRLHRFHMSQGENYFWSLNPFPVALLRLPPKCLSGSPALAIFKPGKSCAQLRCTFQLSFFLQRQNLSSEFLHFCHSHRLLAVASCVAQLLWRCPDCSICHNVKVVLSLNFGTIKDTWVPKAIFAQEKKT